MFASTRVDLQGLRIYSIFVQINEQGKCQSSLHMRCLETKEKRLLLNIIKRFVCFVLPCITCFIVNIYPVHVVIGLSVVRKFSQCFFHVLVEPFCNILCRYLSAIVILVECAFCAQNVCNLCFFSQAFYVNN